MTSTTTARTSTTTPAVAILLATALALAVAALAVVTCPSAALGKTVNASMYGGPSDNCGSTIAAAGGGRLAKGRNIIALRSRHFGDLWKISYKRSGKWHTQLFVNLDYGPASWTGRTVDIGWGGAKRIWFPGIGKVKLTKVGHLPKSKWRKFTHYKNLRECQRKLHWGKLPRVKKHKKAAAVVVPPASVTPSTTSTSGAGQ